MGESDDQNGKSGEDSFEMLLRSVARAPHVSPETLNEVLPNLPAKGDIIDGKFEIAERLGTGGMGAVFSATHVVTKKPVALKWMLPTQAMKKEAELRFIREAQAAGRIDHPNVVDVYDIGRHENAYYLVMERLHGEPLSARQGKGACSPAEAVALLMPVMRGVAAAHAQGVIHRDLKPGNVFLCRGPDGSPREPKVLDFGISKLAAGQTQADVYATADGTRLGTPSYMAPEQLREGTSADHRVDVYALGVMLYELLTGRLPFKAQGTNEMIIEIAAGTPEPLKKQRPELPNALVSVVMKAMARDAEDRYPDVRSLALALEPFGTGVAFDLSGSDSGVQAARTGDWTPVRGRGAWMAALVAVVALVAALAWIALENRDAARVPVAGEPGPETVTKAKPAIRTGAVEAPGTGAMPPSPVRPEPGPESGKAAVAAPSASEKPVIAAPSAARPARPAPSGASSTAASAARAGGKAGSGRRAVKRVVAEKREQAADQETPKDIEPKKPRSRAGEFKIDDF